MIELREPVLTRPRGERLVEERVRACLPVDGLAYPNVTWLAATRDGGARRNGEIDLLVVHPNKACSPSR